MKTNRRKFISTAFAGGLAASVLPSSVYGSGSQSSDTPLDIKARYARIDEILKQPVLKTALLKSPVISTSTLKAINGKIKVPTGPGLGVNIDPDFIKKTSNCKNVNGLHFYW